MGRIVIWIVGLALLSVIYAATIHFQVDDIELDLTDRSNLALFKHEISWAKVVIHGRDAVIEGIPPDEAAINQAKQAVTDVWGIRQVECRCPINNDQEPIQRPSIVTPSLTSSEFSSKKENMALDATTKTIDLRSDQEITTEQCQADIVERLSINSIEFASGSSRISEQSLSLLDELFKVISRCPNTQISIAGHTDNIGLPEENSTLSLDRAEAVRDFLQQAGIPPNRLRAIGYGDSSPIDNNNTEEGRGRNRRIEFHLRRH